MSARFKLGAVICATLRGTEEELDDSGDHGVLVEEAIKISKHFRTSGTCRTKI
jgi:hypothetical protein